MPAPWNYYCFVVPLRGPAAASAAKKQQYGRWLRMSGPAAKINAF
jgi:hypothetical protein